MATIKDIAEKSGFSINTVSRALRGSGYVSKIALEKIQVAAREMTYKPNLAARSLRSRRSFEIAVIGSISPNQRIYSALDAEKIVAMQQCCRENDYNLTVHFISEDQRKENETLVANIASQGIAAAVILSGGECGKYCYETLATEKIPCVWISSEAHEKMNCVYIDRRQGIYDAVEHLYKNGCRKIAYAAASRRVDYRFEGYLDAIRQFDLEEIFIAVPGYGTGKREHDHHASMASAEKMLLQERRVDAVVCYSDFVAAGFLEVFSHEGIKVPNDIAVTGFDGRDFSAILSPPLTTLEQPNHALGRRCIEILLEKIKTGDEISKKTVCEKIPMQLVIRKSSSFER